MRRIAIVGCRPPKDYNAFTEVHHRADDACMLYVRILAGVRCFIEDLSERVVIVSGGAAGVDAEAVYIGARHGCPAIEHRPDYATHGKRAPLERNTLIVADADEVHAWPAPWSRGTWDTIRKARAAGKPCVVHEVK